MSSSLSPPSTHEICRAFVALITAGMMAKRGYRKGALSFSGAISAFFVGFITLASGYRFGAVLLAFYYSGTRVTRFKADKKKASEDGYTHALGQRSAFQVLASSLPAAIFSSIHFALFRGPGPLSSARPVATSLQLAVLLFFSACAGDTFASEIGSVAAPRNPILLVAPWRSVPPGTNGGVSAIGTAASMVGGFIIGAVFLLFSFSLSPFTSFAPIGHILATLITGCLGGLIGSAVDSVLGSTLQVSWFDPVRNKVLKESPKPGSSLALRARRVTGFDILAGESVNCLSALITAALAPLIVPFYRDFNELSW